MNAAYDPMIERIGWMLVHSIWLLTIPATLLTVSLWLIPQNSSRARHATVLITLAVMAMLVTSAASRRSVAQEGTPPSSEAEELNELNQSAAGSPPAISHDGRMNFAGGYYVELAAVADLLRPESDTAAAKAWEISGSVIEEPPFYGTQIRPGLTIAKDQVARKFYFRGRMPSDTTVSLSVDGMRASGSTAQPVVDFTDVEVEADTIAILSEDRETVDVTVNFQLPAWRTLASFDFAGGVKNGIIMDWERQISEFSRYTATGDFGPTATKENIRIIAFDRQHRRLDVAETISEENDEGLTRLKVAFKNSDGRPRYIVVQRRIATHPIVFRDVPLSPGRHAGFRLEISGASDEANNPQMQKSSPRPLPSLLAEPFEPLSAELPDAGTMRLLSVREAGSESPGWHADGSPRLVPFRGEQLWLMRPSTDDNHRKLEAMFEFIASSPDVRIGKIQIRPEDGSGSTSLKPIQDEENNVPGVRLLQALNILDDRDTEDFEVDVFAGPLSELTTLPIVDPPTDYADHSWLGYKPESATKNIAFHINEPKETEAGLRHVVLLVLPEKAPQGSVLTGITTDGHRVDGFTNSTADRKILGTFTTSSDQRLESIEVSTQPRHSMVFRNVSVWSGLGSSAFVDKFEPAAVDFDAVTPSRIFLRPNGQRIAEQDGTDAGASPALAALDEIERRGGLLRFDAEDEAPSGETLPYLTEIRWRDFRADELQWVRPLAGLTRLDFVSEYVTDESLQAIEHLASLEELEVSGGSRQLTTGCLKSIGKLNGLRELQLVSSLKWNEEGYDANDFRNLQGLTKLIEWEPYDWRIDDAGIAWLEDAEDLEMVFGWGPEVTDEGFAALAGKPDLGVIRLGTTKITDASFKLLENHAELYWLSCSSPDLTNAAIDSVITMSNLREVHLFQSQVTDAGVQTLIDSIGELPRLEIVNLSNTGVSQAAVEKLRAAREGLRVLATPPPAEDQTESDEVEPSDQSAESEDESASDASTRDKLDTSAALPARSSRSSQGEREVASAPIDVPWPDKSWTNSLPPGGSGIRVKLDDRRWVEFNSVYAIRKIDGQRSKVHWTAAGKLIDPPADFDPKSLVPDRDGGEMPSVTRGFLTQVVGPEGFQIALDTSGGGGYGKISYPLEGKFVQIPLDKIAPGIGYNHAYVEVKVSKEAEELISLHDPRVQFLSDPEAGKVFVVTENAKDFAWRLMIQRDGEVIGVEPYLVGGGTKRWVPDALQSSLKDRFNQAQVLAFSFDKDQPLPELVSLEQRPFDTVRFDNLSVYPGPPAAVVVSVNGVPIDEANRPELVNPEQMGDDLDLARRFGEEASTEGVDAQADVGSDEANFETVTLTGTVVDENGFGIRDCWVGLFIQPQEYDGQSTRSPSWAKQSLSAFADGPPLTLETKTNALGQFRFEAPKTHFVFEGEFWAMRPDGTVGNQWINAVWSHVGKPDNLKVTIADDEATVRVIDPQANAVANADVTLLAFRGPRRVIQRLPEAVQQRIHLKTDDSGEVTFGGMETAALRGVAVSATGFGTQFLSDRLASSWVRDNQPLTLKLQPTASLAGRVIDFDPQLDQGLKLKARTEQNDDRPPMYSRAIAEVAADGTFGFDHLVAGSVSLKSSLPPDSRRKIRFQYISQIKAGEDRKLDPDHNPKVVPAVVARQRLIKSDTGEGIPGSRLGVLWGDRGDGGRFQQSRLLKTDAEGWWMARVLPGAIDVRLVTVPDGYRSTKWFDGRVGRGGVTATVPATDKVVTLPPERYVPAVELAGRLQYADGSPAGDWSVNGHPVSWDDVGLGAVRTGQDGSFTLTYPTGYPPRLFSTSNREWMTEHDFNDRYVVPKVLSKDPLLLQIQEPATREPK